MDNIDQEVYSQGVIEFTAVANEFCAFAEAKEEYDGIKILKYYQRLIPLLYSKALALPKFESILDDEQEKFVTESDWQGIHDSLIVKLGEANDYLEVFDDKIEFSETAVSASISENIADIYQDLKDYLLSYSMGTNEIMNQALWHCQESFSLYWGQKLVNLLRAVHNALNNPEKIGQQDDDLAANPENIDTSDWLISRRQKESREELDD